MVLLFWLVMVSTISDAASKEFFYLMPTRRWKLAGFIMGMGDCSPTKRWYWVQGTVLSPMGQVCPCGTMASAQWSN